MKHEIAEIRRISTAGVGATYDTNSYWVCSCGEMGEPLETGISVLIRKDYKINHLR